MTDARDWKAIETAPKDGTDVYLPLRADVRAYWDDELGTWVLARPLHIESIREPKEWASIPAPALIEKGPCPHWPGCGCGTQSGPHTCEWLA